MATAQIFALFSVILMQAAFGFALGFQEPAQHGPWTGDPKKSGHPPVNADFTASIQAGMQPPMARLTLPQQGSKSNELYPSVRSQETSCPPVRCNGPVWEFL